MTKNCSVNKHLHHVTLDLVSEVTSKYSMLGFTIWVEDVHQLVVLG